MIDAVQLNQWLAAVVAGLLVIAGMEAVALFLAAAALDVMKHHTHGPADAAADSEEKAA